MPNSLAPQSPTLGAHGRGVGLDVHPDSFAAAILQGRDPLSAKITALNDAVESLPSSTATISLTPPLEALTPLEISSATVDGTEVTVTYAGNGAESATALVLRYERVGIDAGWAVQSFEVQRPSQVVSGVFASGQTVRPATQVANAAGSAESATLEVAIP